MRRTCSSVGLLSLPCFFAVEVGRGAAAHDVGGVGGVLLGRGRGNLFLPVPPPPLVSPPPPTGPQLRRRGTGGGRWLRPPPPPNSVRRPCAALPADPAIGAGETALCAAAAAPSPARCLGLFGVGAPVTAAPSSAAATARWSPARATTAAASSLFLPARRGTLSGSSVAVGQRGDVVVVGGGGGAVAAGGCGRQQRRPSGRHRHPPRRWQVREAQDTCGGGTPPVSCSRYASASGRCGSVAALSSVARRDSLSLVGVQGRVSEGGG